MIEIGSQFKNRRGELFTITNIVYKGKYEDGTIGTYGPNLKLIDKDTNKEITQDDENDLMERVSGWERRKA